MTVTEPRALETSDSARISVNSADWAHERLCVNWGRGAHCNRHYVSSIFGPASSHLNTDF